MGGPVDVGDLVDGKYRLLRMIGEGGWGIVFEAENSRTLKHVALKVLRPQANLTPDILVRFEREAQAAGRIGSEHIVEVFDLGAIDADTHYMVMELLSGQDLAVRLDKLGKLEPIQAVQLMVQLLDGLAAAHSAGILHRDLKPENLFLVPTRSGHDFVKILDFGISKFNSNAVASATMTGAVMGSPSYMAPEQARGLKQLDARTDLYSVGTVLFECVTGHVPFQGDNFNDLMFKIALAPRPTPLEHSPDLDGSLVDIITKSISADPASRFANATEFHDALVDWLESQGVSSIAAPELRRALGHTPRGTGRTPGPSTAAEWAGSTMPLDSKDGSNTPIASSKTANKTTVGKARTTRRGRSTAAVVAGAVLFLVGGGFALKGMRADATAQTSAPVVSPSPVQPPPVSPAASSATQAATPAATANAPIVPSEPLSVARPMTTNGHASPKSGHAARASREPGEATTTVTATKATESTPPVSSVAAAPSVAPAPASPPIDKVEGRDIRSGL